MADAPAPREPSRVLRAVGLGVALAALVGAMVWSQLFPPGSALLHKPAPDVSLPVVANGEPGARLRLSDLAGNVVVLDFWASWCEPCAMQAPILERFARSHAGEVMVVGINLDDEPGVVAQYVKQKSLTYPMVSDEAGDARSAFGATNLPTVVVLDPRGNVASYTQGVVAGAQLEAALAAARQAK
jgi:cytochrome c biogenesis protein CcmG, thiol:disulfide interchange protein DsbE